MQAAGSCEMLVTIYQTTLRHIQEDGSHFSKHIQLLNIYKLWVMNWSAHTVFLCVPYGSHNKQRLFP
jgi:hypothetical protein